MSKVKIEDLKMFDLKPCGQCPKSVCVEEDSTVKCPFDEMVENKVKTNKNYKQKMFMNGFMSLIKDVNK